MKGFLGRVALYIMLLGVAAAGSFWYLIENCSRDSIDNNDPISSTCGVLGGWGIPIPMLAIVLLALAVELDLWRRRR